MTESFATRYAESSIDEDTTSWRGLMLEKARRQLLAAEYVPEIQAFLSRIEKKVKNPVLTGLPTLVRGLNQECQALEQLIAKLDASSSKALDGSELKELDKKLDACTIAINHGAIRWDVLKRCRSFVATSQNFQGSSRGDRKKKVSQMDLNGREKHQRHRALKEQGRAEVDVVDWGRQWIDIRTLHTDRLARQMTDSGWNWGEHELGDVVDEDEWVDISLAKQIRRLVVAARMNRCDYRFPRIRVVLPNVRRGNKDVDVLLEQLCRVDPLVEVTIEDASSLFLTTPPPPPDEAIDNLIGNELDDLTQTLNMDHTILIDLISDITHFRLESQPWQAATTQAQIIEERQHGGLMARTLYPLLADRTLMCTREAAAHFHEVLDTVGTETERERGRLLVPRDNATRSMTDDAIRHRFESLSIHPPPKQVQIPIKITSEAWDAFSISAAVDSGQLPAVALDVARCSSFKPAKLSIYVYGWAAGCVTVTSNREIRGQIRTWVEANRHGNEELGPRIWRVDVTRNLLAKNASPRGAQ